jgi:hypothetical protein
LVPARTSESDIRSLVRVVRAAVRVVVSERLPRPLARPVPAHYRRQKVQGEERKDHPDRQQPNKPNDV